jgi:hypothetical protein
LSENPIFIPRPHDGLLTVRWLVAKDGRCYAREYFDSNGNCRASLSALAMQMALHGVVGRVPRNGHKLKGDYSDLWVLKPGDHRFIGFRHHNEFFLAVAGPKLAPERRMKPLYADALAHRVEFLEARQAEEKVAAKTNTARKNKVATKAKSARRM